jgi:tRNA(Ile2) C34 agmatinyltransferase TiaS
MSLKDNFIEEVIRIIDNWSFEACVFCKDGMLESIEGMVDYRCNKCGKAMNPTIYLGEIAKVVYNYREKSGNDELKSE